MFICILRIRNRSQEMAWKGTQLEMSTTSKHTHARTEKYVFTQTLVHMCMHMHVHADRCT